MTDSVALQPARAALLAAGLVETRRVPHRHRAVAGLCCARRPRRILHSAGREGGKRSADDDRRPRSRRVRLRRNRQATAGDPQPRRGGDLRHLCAVLPGVRAPPPGGDGEADRRVHEGVQLPLSLHRRDHRRQHLRHGPAGADQGLPEDLRPARCRFDRRRHRRHAHRRSPWARRLPHLLLHRDPDHGGRRRRGGDPAVDRLCRDSSSGAGDAVRRRCCRRSCSAA